LKETQESVLETDEKAPKNETQQAINEVLDNDENTSDASLENDSLSPSYENLYGMYNDMMFENECLKNGVANKYVSDVIVLAKSKNSADTKKAIKEVLEKYPYFVNRSDMPAFAKSMSVQAKSSSDRAASIAKRMGIR